MPVRVFHVGPAKTLSHGLCLSHGSEARACMASLSFVHRAVCSSDPEHTDVERRRLSKPELPSLCRKKTHFPTILALSVNMLKAAPILPPRSEAQKESTAPFFRRDPKERNVRGQGREWLEQALSWPSHFKVYFPFL